MLKAVLLRIARAIICELMAPILVVPEASTVVIVITYKVMFVHRSKGNAGVGNAGVLATSCK